MEVNHPFSDHHKLSVIEIQYSATTLQPIKLIVFVIGPSKLYFLKQGTKEMLLLKEVEIFLLHWQIFRPNMGVQQEPRYNAGLFHTDDNNSKMLQLPHKVETYCYDKTLKGHFNLQFCLFSNVTELDHILQ